MKLYWHPFSIMPWRVMITLHEKGIAYESEQVDVHSSKTRTPDFLKLNPFGQIPVLEDAGVSIAESIAILEYLDERYPQPALMPTNVMSRALARQLMCWGTDYWPAAWKKWMAPRLEHTAWTTASVLEGRRELAAHLDIIEPYLHRQEWLVGCYSLADICYAPLVLVLDRVGLAEEITTRPGVSAWVTRLRDRRALQETLLAGVDSHEGGSVK